MYGTRQVCLQRSRGMYAVRDSIILSAPVKFIPRIFFGVGVYELFLCCIGE